MQAHEIKATRVPSSGDTIRVLIGGRASYFAGIEPRANDQDNPDKGMSWQSGILIPKTVSKEVLGVLNQAVLDAVAVGITKKWNGYRPVDLGMPIRDGDEKFRANPEKYAEYAGMLYMTCKKQCELKGGGRQAPPIFKYLSTGEPITTVGVIESGDWVVFDVNFYPFNNRSKGVAVGLNGGSFIKAGERFGGGPSGDSISEEAMKLYGELAGTLQQPAPTQAGSGLESLLGAAATTPVVEDPMAAFFK